MRGGGGQFVLFRFVCVVVRVGCSFDKRKEAGTALPPESTGLP